MSGDPGPGSTSPTTPGTDDGTDVLVTIWDDGTMEIALREGHEQTRVTWGPPLILSSGWHSCEEWQFWGRRNPSWRVATARQMRQAAQKGRADEAAALGRYQEPPTQPSGSGCGQCQPPSR